MSDPVRPSHYKANGIDLIEITGRLDFCRGNAVKYLFRAGRKEGEPELQDLKKALWYIERAIEQEESRLRPTARQANVPAGQVNPQVLYEGDCPQP